MITVFGMQNLKLVDAVTADELENFWRTEFTYVPWEGYTPYLMRGLEGQRQDQYLIALEVAPNSPYHLSTEERQKAHDQHYANHPQNAGMMEKLVAMTGFGTDYTDYATITHTQRHPTKAREAPTIYHYFPLELKSGVTSEQFEAFCMEIWSKTTWVEGLTCYVTKGTKGNRIDQYAFIIRTETQHGYEFEMRPKEERDAVWEQVFAQNPQNRPAVDKLMTLISGFADDELTSTRYVDVGAPVYRQNM